MQNSSRDEDAEQRSSGHLQSLIELAGQIGLFAVFAYFTYLWIVKY